MHTPATAATTGKRNSLEQCNGQRTILCLRPFTYDGNVHQLPNLSHTTNELAVQLRRRPPQPVACMAHANTQRDLCDLLNLELTGEDGYPLLCDLPAEPLHTTAHITHHCTEQYVPILLELIRPTSFACRCTRESPISSRDVRNFTSTEKKISPL